MCNAVHPTLAVKELSKPVMVINEEMTNYMYRIDCLHDLFLDELTAHAPFEATIENHPNRRLMVSFSIFFYEFFRPIQFEI